MQQALRASGYFEGKLITNYFGPQTKKAIVQFQLDTGIIDSIYSAEAGIVGPKTVRALNALHYKNEFTLPYEITNKVRAPAVHPDDLKIPENLQQASLKNSSKS